MLYSYTVYNLSLPREGDLLGREETAVNMVSWYKVRVIHFVKFSIT